MQPHRARAHSLGGREQSKDIGSDPLQVFPARTGEGTFLCHLPLVWWGISALELCYCSQDRPRQPMDQRCSRKEEMLYSQHAINNNWSKHKPSIAGLLSCNSTCARLRSIRLHSLEVMADANQSIFQRWDEDALPLSCADLCRASQWEPPWSLPETTRLTIQASPCTVQHAHTEPHHTAKGTCNNQLGTFENNGNLPHPLVAESMPSKNSMK